MAKKTNDDTVFVTMEYGVPNYCRPTVLEHVFLTVVSGGFWLLVVAALKIIHRPHKKA